MSTHAAEVVVTGGGIGGTVTALLLARIGASVTLLERREPGAATGAGLLLHPNGLAVLAGLGLGPAVAAAGRVLTGSSLRTAAGIRLLDLPAPASRAGFDHLVALRRTALQRILEDALSADARIACRWGTELVDAGADGSVEWRSAEGTGSASASADLVVGADGVHSTVRAAGDFGPIIRRTGERYLRALVPQRSDAPLQGEFWTSLGLFGGAPVDEGTQYVYADATAPAVAAALDAGDLDALVRAWGSVLPTAGRLLAGVGRIDDLIVGDVLRVQCPRWHDGRLVLLGDAAHAMSPTLGQGANTALVDAAVLAIELGADRPVAQALERYERRRRNAALRVQRRADAVARLASIRSGVSRDARDLLLRAVDHVPGVTARAAHDLQQEDPAELAAAVGAVTRRAPGRSGSTAGSSW
jgi:2-polyprenyl-6-methoxyphenol hydroxylase-like FAD-dependent oxidoreductase